MENTDEANEIFDQFIRDALSTEIEIPISEEDLEKQFDELIKKIALNSNTNKVD